MICLFNSLKKKLIYYRFTTYIKFRAITSKQVEEEERAQLITNPKAIEVYSFFKNIFNQ